MKLFLKIFCLIGVVLSAGYAFLVKDVAPEYFKELLPVIEERATDYINGKVSVGKIVWNGGLEAELSDVVIKDAIGDKIAELPLVQLRFRPWLGLSDPLRSLSRVTLQAPQVYLKRDENKKWNTAEFLKSTDSDSTPFYGLLEIKNGGLHVSTTEESKFFSVDGDISGTGNPKFAAELQLQEGENKVLLKGLVTTKGAGNITASSERLILDSYARMLQEYCGVADMTGIVESVRLIYDNDGEKVRYSGTGFLNDVTGVLALRDIEHKIKLSGKITSSDSVVQTDKLSIEVDGQGLLLSGTADLKNPENVSGEGSVSAERFMYDGHAFTGVKLPFSYRERILNISNGTGTYGEGTFIFGGTYNTATETAAGDLELKNIRYAPQASPQNAVTMDGNAAFLVRRADDGFDVNVAAESLALDFRGVKIHKLAFDGKYKNERLYAEHFSAFSGDGSINAVGYIEKNGNMDIVGKMNAFRLQPLLEAVGVECSGGNVSSRFALRGSINRPEMEVSLELRDADIMKQPVKSAVGSLVLKDGIAAIENIVFNMSQGKHILSGTVNLNEETPQLDLTLKTDAVRLEPLAEHLHSGVPLTGNVDNELHIRGSMDAPYAQGNLYASDGSIDDNLFDSITGSYVYDSGVLTLKDFRVDAYAAKVVLNGSMLQDKSLNFDVQSQNVDLGNIPFTGDNVVLAGLVNASGKLRGTLSEPLFVGNVSAENISINGETITDVEGRVNLNGKGKNLVNVSFKQPHKNNTVDYGMYSADLNISLPDGFLSGDILTMWGDVGGILRMCRVEHDIEGIVNGKITMHSDENAGVDIDVTANDVKLSRLLYHQLNFKGRLREGKLYFDDVKLQEKQSVEDRGIVLVNGDVDFEKREYNIGLTARKADPGIVTAMMKVPRDIKGTTDLRAELKGSFDAPTGSASVEIYDGSIDGVSLDKATAVLSLKDDSLKLHQLLLSKDVYNVGASGEIPLDLFRPKEERRHADAHMKIDVDFDDARLGLLPALTDFVEWGIGDIQGKVQIDGTLESPLLYGSIQIKDGSLKLKDVSTVFEQLNLRSEFNGNSINLSELSAKLGKGTLYAAGTYALNTSADTAYSLQVKADNAEIHTSLFSGKITGDVELLPQKYFDFRNRKGNNPPPSAFRPMVKGGIKFDDVLVNMPTIPEFGEGSSNYGMDLQIELGPKIHFYNSFLYDLWVSGGLKLKGSTIFPVIEGSVKSTKGTVTYLRTNFKVDEARLVWIDAGSFIPNINLESRARFNRYNIAMRIAGQLDNMDLQLSSDPPLDKNTIVRMLTLQRDIAGNDYITGDDMANLLTAGLQMTILGEVEDFVEKWLGLDQFKIYNGRVRSGIGYSGSSYRVRDLTKDERRQYNILVSKYLTDRFMIGYTTSFDGIDRSIFGQYDISDNFNITYSHNSSKLKEKEHWYGVEYKLTF